MPQRRRRPRHVSSQASDMLSSIASRSKPSSAESSGGKPVSACHLPLNWSSPCEAISVPDNRGERPAIGTEGCGLCRTLVVDATQFPQLSQTVHNRSLSLARIGARRRRRKARRYGRERNADRRRRGPIFGFDVGDCRQRPGFVPQSLIPLSDGGLALLKRDLSLLNSNRRGDDRADQEHCDDAEGCISPAVEAAVLADVLADQLVLGTPRKGATSWRRDRGNAGRAR